MYSPLCEVDMLERGASGLQRLHNILHPDSRRHVQVACVPCGITVPSEADVVQGTGMYVESHKQAEVLLTQHFQTEGLDQPIL